MKKTVLLLASLAVAVLLASGVALAATVNGSSGDDTLYGTQNKDNINPFGGRDIVYALSGADSVRHSYDNDYILGGRGDDTLRGGFDNDHIWGGPGRDLIDCAYVASRDKGEAWDVAYANREPREERDVVVDCKTVVWEDKTNDETRIISIDPVTGEPTLTQ